MRRREPRENKVLERVFTRAGSISTLAAELGITQTTVSQWKQVPVRRLRDVERITGIPRRELRPDIFDDA